MGKQLVAVDTLWATLRPSKTLPFEDPYPEHFLHLRPIHKDFWKRKGVLFFLLLHPDCGTSVVVGSAGLEEDTLLVAQLPPQRPTEGDNLLSGLLVLARLVDITRRDYRGVITIIAQPYFSRQILSTANTARSDATLYAQWQHFENRHGILRHTFLPPRKIPEGFRHIFELVYNASPPQLLHRNWNFTQAKYVPFRRFMSSKDF